MPNATWPRSASAPLIGLRPILPESETPRRACDYIRLSGVTHWQPSATSVLHSLNLLCEALPIDTQIFRSNLSLEVFSRCV